MNLYTILLLWLLNLALIAVSPLEILYPKELLGRQLAHRNFVWKHYGSERSVATPVNSSSEEKPIIPKKINIQAPEDSQLIKKNPLLPRNFALLLKTKLKMELIKPELQFNLESKLRECALMDNNFNSSEFGYYKLSDCTLYVPKLTNSHNNNNNNNINRPAENNKQVPIKRQVLKRTLDLLGL